MGFYGAWNFKRAIVEELAPLIGRTGDRDSDLMMRRAEVSGYFHMSLRDYCFFDFVPKGQSIFAQ